MKLVTDDEIVMGSGGKSTDFTIKASAKAFRVLSSNLYKNKIRAIVRELSTNCIDAHFLNGCTRPFEIKVPSRLDPRFVIRDFGPGLDEDGMINLYTTFFESTKNNSNDFIGALGLGSKSPLSYTNTFTVVSNHGGRSRGYTVMMDGGLPKIRPTFDEEMAEGETTGLEITVPVKTDDISSWQHEIKYVLRPMGAGSVVLKGTQMEVDFFPDQDVHTTDQYNGYENNGIYAIYGKIVYPLNDVPGVKDSWLRARYSRVYIKFPLGELDITPSREELSLDPDTVANIQARVSKINQEYLERDIQELDEITNERELVRKYNEFGRAERNIIANSGVKTKLGSIATILAKYDVSKLRDMAMNSGAVAYDGDDVKLYRFKNSYGGRSKIYVDSILGVDKKKLTVLIDDKTSKRVATIRALKHAGKIARYDFVLVINPESELQQAFLKKAIELMAEDEVVTYKVSECEELRAKLPKVESDEPAEKRPASPNGARYTYSEKNGWAIENLKLTSSELSELEGFVLLRSRDDFMTFPAKSSISCFSDTDARILAQECGITEFLVMRPSGCRKALFENENLVDMMAYIIERYIDAIDEVDYDCYLPRNFRSNRVINHIINKKKLGFLLTYFVEGNANSDSLNRLVNMNQRLSNVTVKDNTDLALCNQIYNKLEETSTTAFTVKMKEFNEKYPVIDTVLNEWHLEQAQIDDIVKIMAALEAAEQSK
ncbi:rIIA protector from prophage-induced early lysis [Klebsiella phage PhiKpNIH-6]|uniref:RIIA protector from prophage-induced early lysis n=1 Tax=Klebsiella phage PhiKpNIH-6 TaxID=2689112 RepID=A0A6B9M397_9CAUD|nr:rIIA protector from prophage-induced early lysis [Klebsiella phage PhiKpNIH-6]